jgi:energy-coupling factor transport system permease protein
MKRTYLALAIALLLVGWASRSALGSGSGHLAASSPTHYAGLVVQFEDGSVVRECLSFSEENITGLELLGRSGLDIAIWGTAVCRIESAGCDYPAERCFCECLAPPCRFWSYWQWRDGRWVYSEVGASQRQVSDGDIDGWVWGDGQTPPAADLEQICSTAGREASTQRAEPGPDPSAGQTQGSSVGNLVGQYALFCMMALGLVVTLSLVRIQQRAQRPASPHTLAWLAWLGAAAYLALVNQQPLQSVLLVFATGTLFGLSSRSSPRGAQSWGAFLRFGFSVWIVALVFGVLSADAGDIVLVTFPRQWPIIGGPITLESVLYGLASGASLFAVLLVFATFNLAVEMHRVLRWIPAGLYQVGLIASIALAFVPQMIASLNDIREAQRVRGHKYRGLRDLVPLFVPLVTTALERSLTLAESMEARGFGGIMGQRTLTRVYVLRITTLAGLVALLAGLISRTLDPQGQQSAWVWLVLGTTLTLGTLYAQGRQVKRSNYRRERWQQRDTWVTLASAVSALLVVVTQIQDRQALWYYPYPPFSPWPTFAPLVGLAAMLLAAPALPWPTSVGIGQGEKDEAPDLLSCGVVPSDTASQQANNGAPGHDENDTDVPLRGRR